MGLYEDESYFHIYFWMFWSGSGSFTLTSKGRVPQVGHNGKKIMIPGIVVALFFGCRTPGSFDFQVVVFHSNFYNKF